MTGQSSSYPENSRLPFQKRVVNWLMECFSMEVCRDGTERNHRFLEESLELVQSLGCTASEAHQLVDYVYGRPIGDPVQELGGVQVTLAALCFPHGLDMEAAAETELARVWTKIEKIRAKQAAKPKHSPLPQHVDAAQRAAEPAFSDEVVDAALCEYWDLGSRGGWTESQRVGMRKAILTALAAQPSPAADSGWQPIETAPDNHLPVQAYGLYGQIVAFRDVNWIWWAFPNGEDPLNYTPTHWKSLGPSPSVPSTSGGPAA